MPITPSPDPASPPPLLPDGSSLFLDFDGTLVETATKPDEVAIAPGLAELLLALSTQLDGRVALLSGRSIASIDDLLGQPMHALAISGSHGCEFRWQSQAVHPVRPVAELEQVFRRLDDFAFGHPGTLVESKAYGVALHYRGNPACAGDAQRLAEHLAAESGFVVENGKMFVELRSGGNSLGERDAKGSDKGAILRDMMACAPMRGGIPVYLGDDMTDEAGFAAVNAMNGLSILVGPARVTNAAFNLSDPASVHAWLSQCLAAAPTDLSSSQGMDE